MALKPVVTQTSANFTRPADTTQYASGDIVANSTTAGSVAAMQFTVEVAQGRAMNFVSWKLETDNTTATSADFKLHLYASDPTATNGDNSAWLTTESNYMGAMGMANALAFSDAIAIVTKISGTDAGVYWRLATGTIVYGILEAQATYTPASAEVFTVTLNIEHN